MRTHNYGRCTITGPDDDVAFIFAHLPDVDAPPQAAVSERKEFMRWQTTKGFSSDWGWDAWQASAARFATQAPAVQAWQPIETAPTHWMPLPDAPAEPITGEWRGECNMCPAAALHAFKNFHRLLCERFGYGHDEKDWRRDQLSLIEFIAAKVQAPA